MKIFFFRKKVVFYLSQMYPDHGREICGFTVLNMFADKRKLI